MHRDSKIFKLISSSIIAVFLSEMPIFANPDILNKSLLASRQALLAPKTNLGSSPEPEAEIGSSDQEGSTQQEAPQQRKGGLLRRIALEGAILFGIGLSIAAFYTFSSFHFSVEKILLGGLLIFAGIVIEAAVFSSWLASKLIKVPENRPVNYLRRRWAYPLIFIAAVSIGSVFYVHHAIVSRVNYFSFRQSLALVSTQYSLRRIYPQEILDKINSFIVASDPVSEGRQVAKELNDMIDQYSIDLMVYFSSEKKFEEMEKGRYEAALITPEVFQFLREGTKRYPDSLAAKINILEAKRSILNIMGLIILNGGFDGIHFGEGALDACQSYIRILGKLLESEEEISDALLSKGSLLSKEDIKNIVKDFNSNVKRAAHELLFIMSTHHSLPESLKVAAANEINQRPKPPEWEVGRDTVYQHEVFKEEIEEIQNLKGANVHQIHIEEVKSIREVRRLPREYRPYFQEAARAHRIPVEVLIANLIKVPALETTLRSYRGKEGLDILHRRGELSKSRAEYLKSHLPRSIMSRNLGAQWTDFLGGVIFSGDTSIGPYQMRPIWVRRYQGWERFGIDADGLSKREIARRLLDPKYSIEARAKMFRAAIEQVKKFQKEAQKGQLPDLSQFYNEAMRERRGMGDTLEYYLSIPLLSSDEEKYDWILGQSHPMYSDVLRAHLYHQKLVIKSGILDNKPAEFVGITTAEEIEQLMDIYKIEDPYFKDTVVRTLERLMLHADPEIREKASRSLKSLPRPTSQRGEIQKQQGDSLKSQLDKAPEAYEPDWIRSKKFKKFLSWVQKIPNGQISSDNIINNFLFLEMKVGSREEVKRTYKFLSESIHQVKQKIHYSLSPEEQLKRVHEILTLDLKIQIKSDRNKILLSDSLPNKILDCATASLVYLAIADELNLPLFVARAPNHVFIRYADEERQFNFETTSGELKTNDDYKNWLGIHELSVNNGVFLKSLSQKELYGLVYFNIGNVEASRGHYKEAVKYYLQALRLNPKDAEACSNLGNVKNKLKEYKEYLSAIKYSTKATKLDPLDVQSYYNRGASKYKLGIYLGAIKDFTWAIKLNPNYAKAYFSRGLAYEALGQFDKAIKDQKKALELDPSLVIHLLSVIGEIKGEPSLNSTL